LKSQGCPFDSPAEDEINVKNSFWYARWDKYPVSKGHLLVIPFRHVRNCFDLSEGEWNSLFEILFTCKKVIAQRYAPDGYNIRANIGYAAGQSVMHCHIHIIPRYAGDTEHPRGGIRNVIPKKHQC
jgi:diadenosine tetraphosphate (Ap4A) HIT family hydrolase